jgi:hypothetical protein
MASSSFTLAIDALIRERDYKFVSQIAADYNLNVDELYEKYTATADKLTPKPVKKRKATVEMLDDAGQPVGKKAKGACQGITSKKETCKFSALKGGCFCKRHQKAHEEEQEAKKAGIEVPAKKLKEPKEPKVKPTEPIHDHAVDGVVHEECGLCQSHGAIFGGIFEAEEVHTEELGLRFCLPRGSKRIIAVMSDSSYASSTRSPHFAPGPVFVPRCSSEGHGAGGSVATADAAAPARSLAVGSSMNLDASAATWCAGSANTRARPMSKASATLRPTSSACFER